MENESSLQTLHNFNNKCYAHLWTILHWLSWKPHWKYITRGFWALVKWNTRGGYWIACMSQRVSPAKQQSAYITIICRDAWQEPKMNTKIENWNWGKTTNILKKYYVGSSSKLKCFLSTFRIWYLISYSFVFSSAHVFLSVFLFLFFCWKSSCFAWTSMKLKFFCCRCCCCCMCNHLSIHLPQLWIMLVEYLKKIYLVNI